jgi:hypothetical protein
MKLAVSVTYEKKRKKKRKKMLGFFLSDLLKESPNELFVFMVPDLYLETLRLLMMKTAEKLIFDMIF